ncbi:MAG: hypothetical protein PHY47_00685 [Lachnospiraceae bacterium]|nr:hypothetical protein [Lachnospiraceae bacterium]
MIKRKNKYSGTCHRCNTFCGAEYGWREGELIFHNSCYNSYLEDKKKKPKKKKRIDGSTIK